MILLMELVDLDEFTRDVFSMAGLILRTEVPRASWDPDAWTISAEFGSKWGYLFL